MIWDAIIVLLVSRFLWSVFQKHCNENHVGQVEAAVGIIKWLLFWGLVLGVGVVILAAILWYATTSGPVPVQ